MAFTLGISALLLVGGLFIVMRVQNKTLENMAIQDANRLLYQAYSGKSPQSLDLAGFYILNIIPGSNSKLYNFNMISGWDHAKPAEKLSGKLNTLSENSKDKRFQALLRKAHDAGAESLSTGRYYARFESRPGKPPVLIFSIRTSPNQVSVVFMPVKKPAPSAPWLMLFISLLATIAVVFFVSNRYAPIYGVLTFACLAGLTISAYRMNPSGPFYSFLTEGFRGFGKGYFVAGWLGLSAIAFGLAITWFTGHASRFFRALREFRLAYTYIFPAMIGMMVLVLIPFAAGLALGFFNHCRGEFQFVGFSNFIDILSGGGSSLTNPLNFWFTLGVTILWTSVNVFLHVSIGLGIALILKDPLLKMKGIYRVLLIIPWAMPNYITALMWKGMFQQQYGAINILLDNIGIGSISWFSSFWPAFMANVITNTWLGFPFMMVVSLGALQSIPTSLYEAAEVDGASRWQQFKTITLPLLRPALFPAIVLGSIWTFNMFNVIYLVSGGEPGGATDILITEAYQWAFKRGERYGLAAAYATLIFVILYLYTKATNKITRAAEDM